MTEVGTYVPRGEAALITEDGMERMSLLIPDHLQSGVDVPPLMLFLTAVMVRAERDEDFFMEQLEWMEANRDG